MDLLPGFCQGIVRVLISYPFDAVKVFSQNNGQRPWVNFKQQLRLNPTIFYRGAAVPMLTVSLDRAIQYKYFEQYKSQYNPYAIGAALGVFSSLLSVPMQFITSNVLLLSKTEYGSLANYLRSELRQSGLFGLYKGYSIEVPRSALATSVYLGTYGTLRQALSDTDSNVPSPWITTISAIGASWSSWIVVFPLDTVRTLYQVDKHKGQSLAQLTAQRYQQMGLLSFWRGLTPVLLRTAPSSIAGMIVYESVRQKILY